MKITIIGTAYPFRGGLATYNERLANEFISQNNEVTIETFKLQYPKFLFPGKTQYSTSTAPEDLKINISVNSINPLNWIKVGHRIKREKPDLVIFKFWIPLMGPCFGTIARIIKQNKTTKIITILDNLIPHESRMGDKILTKYFINSSDGYIAMSKSVIEEINLFSTRKPRILSPHPLFDNFGKKILREDALNQLDLPLNQKYILFFGFIRDYKGLDLLIDAFADKRFRQMPIKLIVAGEFYSDSKKYIDQIRSLGLENDIILRTDYIPNDDVAKYFSACNIIAQPYKSATQSGVTQIGFHFEKPMLVTNVGGLSEIILHGKIGYVTEPNKLEIANCLVDFFSSNQSDIFEVNITEEKKKYSWEYMYEKIIRLYNIIKDDHTK